MTTTDPNRLHAKYVVTRTDGRDKPNTDYFVLDMANDPHARSAMFHYADRVSADNPALAQDILNRLAVHAVARMFGSETR